MDYKVITLCGSTKFKKQFEFWERKLTLEGNIVLTVGLFGHADNIELTPLEKNMLDDMHKRKIDMSDSIVVINVDDYIGYSTRSEILYALRRDIEVSYIEEYPRHIKKYI